jgi:hypothetical protein
MSDNASLSSRGEWFTFPFPLAPPPEYNAGMGEVVVAVLGVAFAAFCVWLGVRIVNRRERWAKWTAVALLVLTPVLYVLSIGPAAWLHTRHLMPESLSSATRHFYDPIHWIMGHGPEPVGRAITWYAQLWSANAPPDTPARIR